MKILWICLQTFLLCSLLSTTNGNRKWLEEKPLEKNYKQQETYYPLTDARGRQVLDSNSLGKESSVQEKPAFNPPNDQENSNERNQPNNISGTVQDEGKDNGNTEENDPYNHYRGSTIDNHHQITIDEFRRGNHYPGPHS
ncbi:hypothetical protein AMTRI_Chr07g29480 [Amborella trichopoda]